MYINENEIYGSNNQTQKIMVIDFIRKLLYQYPYLENKIRDREKELLKTDKITSYEFIKGNKSIKDISNILLNDKKLKIYKNRKDFLDKTFKHLKKSYPKVYNFMIKKYFIRVSNEDIKNEINSTDAGMIELDLKLIKYIGNKLTYSKNFLCIKT